ncbi:ligand-binding sensor domain-containing protein [Sphingobacterium zeae]|uniref:ligand-binding sensor domain-containing protein n=1 Tax=Sphingobacterium zeae TaxID=1776859 RepID=UPI00360FEB03
MSYPTFLVWLILQFSVVVCHAQYYFKHYQTQDGLPHQAVRSILQDGKGFMWVGTRAGLCRFDGYNFKLCENKNDPFNNIGNNVINTLTEGQPGILWIGTGKGMYRYDTIGEVISPVDLIPQLYIEQVMANGDDIWFIANSSLWRYSIKKSIVKNYQIQTTALFLDGAKNLWTGNKRGEIRVFDPRGALVKTMRTVNFNRPSNMNTISAIFPLDDAAVLVGYFGAGLKRYDLDKRMTTTIVLNGKDDSAVFVRDICKGNNGDYWVATESGVYIYNPNIKKCRHLGKRADDPYAMTDNAVYKVCKDRSGGCGWALFLVG